MHDSTPSAPLLISIIESVIGLPPSDVASSAKLWVFSCIILIKEACGFINDIDLKKMKNIKVIASNLDIMSKFQEKIHNF